MQFGSRLKPQRTRPHRQTTQTKPEPDSQSHHNKANSRMQIQNHPPASPLNAFQLPALPGNSPAPQLANPPIGARISAALVFPRKWASLGSRQTKARRWRFIKKKKREWFLRRTRAKIASFFPFFGIRGRCWQDSTARSRTEAQWNNQPQPELCVDNGGCNLPAQGHPGDLDLGLLDSDFLNSLDFDFFEFLNLWFLPCLLGLTELAVVFHACGVWSSMSIAITGPSRGGKIAWVLTFRHPCFFIPCFFIPCFSSASSLRLCLPLCIALPSLPRPLPGPSLIGHLP